MHRIEKFTLSFGRMYIGNEVAHWTTVIVFMHGIESLLLSVWKLDKELQVYDIVPIYVRGIIGKHLQPY